MPPPCVGGRQRGATASSNNCMFLMQCWETSGNSSNPTQPLPHEPVSDVPATLPRRYYLLGAWCCGLIETDGGVYTAERTTCNPTAASGLSPLLLCMRCNDDLAVNLLLKGINIQKTATTATIDVCFLPRHCWFSRPRDLTAAACLPEEPWQ